MEREVTHRDGLGRDVLLKDNVLYSDYLSGTDNSSAKKYGYKYGFSLMNMKPERMKDVYNLTPIQQLVPSKTPKEVYWALFRKWVELTGLKVGDKVKIVAGFQDYAPEHGIHMNDSMRKLVGETGEVTSIGDSFSPSDFLGVVSVKCKDNCRGWNWDFRSLEKVEPKTYSAGDKFQHGSNNYMLVVVSYNGKSPVALISFTEGGLTFNGAHDVSNWRAITEDEMKNICGTLWNNPDFKQITS